MGDENTYVLGNAWIPARFWSRVTTDDPMIVHRLLSEGYIKERSNGEREIYPDREQQSK
jgi:hypothetical protein